jgi:hypothetical protein
MKLATVKLDKLMQPVYDLRAELGLPRGEQPILAGQHSPAKVLALFSKVLAAPHRDWPANTCVTGFPFYDRRDLIALTTRTVEDNALFLSVIAGYDALVAMLAANDPRTYAATCRVLAELDGRGLEVAAGVHVA